MEVILEIDIVGNHNSNPIDDLLIEQITKKHTFELDYNDFRAWEHIPIGNILHKIMGNYVKRQQFHLASDLRDLQKICIN